MELSSFHIKIRANLHTEIQNNFTVASNPNLYFTIVMIQNEKKIYYKIWYIKIFDILRYFIL